MKPNQDEEDDNINSTDSLDENEQERMKRKFGDPTSFVDGKLTPSITNDEDERKMAESVDDGLKR